MAFRVTTPLPSAGHCIGTSGDPFVSLSHGVLVVQRRSCRAVADARHQLLGARTRRGGERVTGNVDSRVCDGLASLGMAASSACV